MHNNVDKPKRKRKTITVNRLPAIPDIKQEPAKHLKITPNVSMITQDGIIRCRFDMFVKVKPGIASPHRSQQRTWCYRGDKFTTEEPKMLKNLIKHIINNGEAWGLIELYDNTISKDNGQRILLRIQNGTIRHTRLADYQHMLTDFPLHQLTDKYPLYDKNKNNEG
jgi:hypothetical protein